MNKEQRYFVRVDKNLYPISKAFKFNIKYDKDKFFIDSSKTSFEETSEKILEEGIEILIGTKEYLKRLLGITEQNFEK